MICPKANGIYRRKGGLYKPHAEGHYEDLSHGDSVDGVGLRNDFVWVCCTFKMALLLMF